MKMDIGLSQVYLIFPLRLFEGRREKSDDCFFVAAVKRLFKGNDQKSAEIF